MNGLILRPIHTKAIYVLHRCGSYPLTFNYFTFRGCANHYLPAASQSRSRYLNQRLQLTSRRFSTFERVKMSSEERVPKAKALNEMSEVELKQFFGNMKAVMFDCDGVLWLGNEPLENAQALVIKLRELGKKVFFVTNNSTNTREGFLHKFNTLGFQATEDEIVSTAYLTALYLKELGFKRKVYVIGSQGIIEELNKVGIESLPIGPDPVPASSQTWKSQDFEDTEMDPEVGAVIVGFDHHFSYNKALKAATYLNQRNRYGEEVLFIGTNTDEQFPGRGPKKFVFPGTGTFVKAVQTCSGRDPVIIGKPALFPFKLTQKQFNLDQPSQVLMVGDRGNTDILFGRKCSMSTLLVLSGVTRLEDMHKWEESKEEEVHLCTPHYYSSNVNEVFQLLSKSI